MHRVSNADEIPGTYQPTQQGDHDPLLYSPYHDHSKDEIEVLRADENKPRDYYEPSPEPKPSPEATETATYDRSQEETVYGVPSSSSQTYPGGQDLDDGSTGNEGYGQEGDAKSDQPSKSPGYNTGYHFAPLPFWGGWWQGGPFLHHYPHHLHWRYPQVPSTPPQATDKSLDFGKQTRPKSTYSTLKPKSDHVKSNDRRQDPDDYPQKSMGNFHPKTDSRDHAGSRVKSTERRDKVSQNPADNPQKSSGNFHPKTTIITMMTVSNRQTGMTQHTRPQSTRQRNLPVISTQNLTDMEMPKRGESTMETSQDTTRSRTTRNIRSWRSTNTWSTSTASLNR